MNEKRCREFSHKRTRSQNIIMSMKTKEFLQKICYKQTASIDMTSNGFYSDSKLLPIRLFLKPIALQLEKILGKPNPGTMAKKETKTRKNINKFKVTN